MKPKVSVIIPVYNSEKYIEKCINSVLEQDYQEFELILINDGSKDGSLKILERYKTILSGAALVRSVYLLVFHESFWSG